jgi:cobalt-zinc-cadmium efflux system protein
MPHSHDHHHHHSAPEQTTRAFAIGVAVNVGYVAVEAGYGLAIGSLALLADAGHNLTDVLGLLLAWGAAHLSSRPPTRRFTYGLGSTSILAALSNALLLLVAVGGIAWEAFGRLDHPSVVSGRTVMVVAGIGVLINTGTALLFLRGRHHDLNIRGAFLHMAADAAVSLAVVLGGLGIATLGWLWLDPVLSLLIAGVILWSTWGLLKDSLNLALQAVPAGIDASEVEQYLCALPGVTAVHDLHIWAMSTTRTALTAHLVCPKSPADNDAFLADVAHGLEHRFNISHATIQIEHNHEANGCRLAPPDVI